MATEASIQLMESPDASRIAIVHMQGEIDETNLAELDSVITPLAKEKQIPILILNFDGLQFINSKVIGFLASTFSSVKHSGNQLMFCNASEAINDIISLVGLDSIVPMYSNLEEALNAAQ